MRKLSWFIALLNYDVNDRRTNQKMLFVTGTVSNKFECMNVYKSYNKKLIKPIRQCF